MGLRLLVMLIAFCALAGTASAADGSREGTTIVFSSRDGERIDVRMAGSRSAAAKELRVIAQAGSANMTSRGGGCGGNAGVRSARTRSTTSR